jgi:hypothetical protein
MVSKRKLRGTEPFPGAQVEAASVCPLCGRMMIPGRSSDEHHLLPKSRGGREKFLVHRVCHRKIHATLSEKELARAYASWEALRAHPEIHRFIQWLANKPPEFNR